jgi:hypothetical protein
MLRKSTVARLGRILLDLAIVMGIAYLGYQMAGSAKAASDARASLRIAEREARSLYDAFDRYFEDYRAFPGTHTEPRLELDTLEPLTRRGYYRGALLGQLLRQRADAYESPDDRGLNREFWLEMTLQADPSIRFLVARSDDAPLGGGKWLDGAFILRDGRLERL